MTDEPLTDSDIEPPTIADDLAAALTAFMENDCARLDMTAEQWQAAEQAMRRYREARP